MRILKGMTVIFFLALFLTSGSFADDAKSARTSAENTSAEKKDQPVAAADSEASDPKSDPATTPAPPAAPAANPAPAPVPQRSPSQDSYEQVPKYVPMPALDGNPGLFTLETG